MSEQNHERDIFRVPTPRDQEKERQERELEEAKERGEKTEDK